MERKYCCVVDGAGYYDFVRCPHVLVTLEQDKDGSMREKIYGHVLASGERLVDTYLPARRTSAGTSGFIKPRWTGIEWAEGATPEEITAWELEHPAPPPPTPTLEERNRADIDYLLVMGGHADELV